MRGGNEKVDNFTYNEFKFSTNLIIRILLHRSEKKFDI